MITFVMIKRVLFAFKNRKKPFRGNKLITSRFNDCMMYDQVVLVIFSLVLPATLYLLTRPPKKKSLPPTLTDAVGDDETHRINNMCKSKTPKIRTAFEAFNRGLMLNPSGDFLGYRQMDVPGAPYKWLSYKEVNNRARNIGSALVNTGFARRCMVGIYAKNSPTWHIILQSCNAFCFTIVPLYDTLGSSAMTHILTTCELEIVFVDSHLVYNILKWANNTNLKMLVVIGEDISADSQSEAKRLGIKIISLKDLELSGTDKRSKPSPPDPDDLAVICYTSGTTGTPKGAMISHGNIAEGCMGIKQNLYTFTMNHDDTMISYLPLAHVYEFAIECYFSYIGGRIGYYQGNLLKLLDDFETLQPTLIPSVPRVLNKAYDRVNSLVHSKPVIGKLYDMGVRSKMKEVESGIVRNNSIWDYFIFRKVQRSFGGKLRILITGSAPCRKDILTWYRAVLGCFIMEGFGQTEISGVGSMSLENDTSAGHIGIPLPNLEVKLVNVPEKEYFTKDNKGEICFRGTSVFKGYYNDPQKTAETIDSDGWLHTGDIGTWTNHGCLSIIDRKKNIFKLAQGEYIAPDKIEGIYERAPIALQCFVYGESLKSSLVGIVIPDPVEVEKQFPGVSMSSFVRDKSNAGYVLQIIQTLGQKELRSFEQVRHVSLQAEPFSVENNLLTPTSKKRREAIADAYKDALQEMMSTMV